LLLKEFLQDVLKEITALKEMEDVSDQKIRFIVGTLYKLEGLFEKRSIDPKLTWEKGKAKVSKEGSNSCKFCGKAHSNPNKCEVLNRAVREALRDQVARDAMDVDATKVASGNKESNHAVKSLKRLAKRHEVLEPL
ncbi:hypothetical protein HDU96_008389, partial [Phlyctochytrium bullatum]